MAQGGVSDLQHYTCNNPNCDLGSPGSPGIFTSGVSKDPETGELTPEDGFCPNCNQQGTAIDIDTYEPEV